MEIEVAPYDYGNLMACMFFFPYLQAVWRHMARLPDMKWFMVPPDRTIEGYSDVIAKPMCMQDIARKLFRGRFRKSKLGLASVPTTPRTPSVGLEGSGTNGSDSRVCEYCQATFGSGRDLVGHLRVEHFYADEFNESTKRKGRFHADMLLIFKNCRTFNESSEEFCKIADDVSLVSAVKFTVSVCAFALFLSTIH